MSIRPAIEMVGAALLIAAAPLIFIFGPEVVLIVVYGIFPIEVRRRIWEIAPPESVRASAAADQALAAVVLFLGLLLAAGLFGAYPTWRKPFLWLTGALLAGVAALVILVFGQPMKLF